MVKGLATITFVYEMDETDEYTVDDQIVADQDDLRKMVERYFLDIRHKPEELDVTVEIA